MQSNIDRSATEIKCSIGVDGTTQYACSIASNGKLSQFAPFGDLSNLIFIADLTTLSNLIFVSPLDQYLDLFCLFQIGVQNTMKVGNIKAGKKWLEKQAELT